MLFLRLVFVISVIDKKTSAAGALSRRNVAPAVANHIAGGQIDIKFASGIEQQARLRFATGAPISVDMRAHLDRIERKFCHQPVVHLRKHHRGLLAGRQVGLVGDDDIEKSSFAKFQQRVGNARQNFKFFQCDRRKRLAVAHESAVDHSIAIQKNGPPRWWARPSHHLVAIC